MAQSQAGWHAGVVAARHIPHDTPLNALPCGTEVLTLDGALPVDHLAPGDRVITRDSGFARLVALRVRSARLQTVTIAPGTLGHMRPDQSVTLPATQEILLRDWRAAALFGAARVLVPVARLIDGRFVRAAGPRDVRLFELHFDAPHILYADGLELASALPARIPA